MSLSQEPIPQFMTLNEVAERLKISRWTVNRWIKREINPIPVVYFTDRTPRVPWEQFELWVDSQLEGGEQT